MRIIKYSILALFVLSNHHAYSQLKAVKQQMIDVLENYVTTVGQQM